MWDKYSLFTDGPYKQNTKDADSNTVLHYQIIHLIVKKVSMGAKSLLC